MNKILKKNNMVLSFIIVPVLALTMVFYTAVLIFAMDTGDTVKYSGKLADHCSHQFWSADKEYRGTCCQIGNPADDSGTARVTKLSNKTETAKIAWYVYSKDWLDDHTNEPSGITGLGYHYAGLATNFIQISQQGKSTWKRTAMSDEGYGEWVCDKVMEKYENALASIDDVPDGFEVFLCEPAGGSQRFILWKYEPNGYLALKKTSQWALRNADSKKTLKGAVYGVYTDKACTKAAKDDQGNTIRLTTGTDGSSNVVQAEKGTYYAKEITASPGYSLDTTVRKISVSSDNDKNNPAVFESVERPLTGFVSMKKRSADADITG